MWHFSKSIHMCKSSIVFGFRTPNLRRQRTTIKLTPFHSSYRHSFSYLSILDVDEVIVNKEGQTVIQYKRKVEVPQNIIKYCMITGWWPSRTLRTALAGEASGTVTAVAVNIVHTHAAILTRIRFTLINIFNRKKYKK